MEPLEPMLNVGLKIRPPRPDGHGPIHVGTGGRKPTPWVAQTGHASPPDCFAA